jgi:hypothetical protein
VATTAASGLATTTPSGRTRILVISSSDGRTQGRCTCRPST